MVAVKTDAQVLYMADNGLPVTSADVRRLMAEKNRLRDALLMIRGVGGNIPDERLETATGANDAKHRGIMLVTCREIARAALRSEQGESDE